MNERDFKIKLVQAFGGEGGYGNERDFWGSLLTVVYGVPTRADNEREFWRKLTAGIQGFQPPLTEEEVVVSDSESITINNDTYTFTVSGGEITDIVVS